jgi:hypothetical protein
LQNSVCAHIIVFFLQKQRAAQKTKNVYSK